MGSSKPAHPRAVWRQCAASDSKAMTTRFNWIFPLKFTLVLCCVGSLRGAVAGREWWRATPSDAGWTNKSVNELKAAAERGEAAAQFYYARTFFIGEGGQRNP